MSSKLAHGNSAWELVLVRHVEERKRNDVSYLSSLIKAPFESHGSGSGESRTQQTSPITALPRGRWLLGARFPKKSWIPLYTNAATCPELFTANSENRRLEVAWLGCEPNGRGYFLQLRQAGQEIVTFAQSLEVNSKQDLNASDLPKDFLKGSQDAEQSFSRLCTHFEIEFPFAEVRATANEFQVIGPSGKTLKSGVCGYVCIHGPELTAKESPASVELKKALDRRDAKAVRAAVKKGASLRVLPDTPLSPLRSALFNCNRTGGEECVRVLFELGCEPGSLVADSVANYIPEKISLKMLTLLVEHGADVNASLNGTTALFNAVVEAQHSVVQFLMAHGANPNIKSSYGLSPVEWLRKNLNEEPGISRRTELAELLELVTGESVVKPVAEQISKELIAENERFAKCRKSQLVIRNLPNQFVFERVKISRLHKLKDYEPWSKELLEDGFEFAGFFWEKILIRVDMAVFLNERLRMEATLSSSKREDRLKCSIGAYHPDGTATVAINYHEPVDPDFQSRCLTRVDCVGASPRELRRRLAERLDDTRQELKPIEPEVIEQRHLELCERYVDDLRQQAQAVLDTPVIRVGNAPARFERMKFYLDFSDRDDPSYSTQRLAASGKKDLDAVDIGNLDDSFKASSALREATYLVAMRHFQFVGAPQDPGLVQQGCRIAVAFFEAMATRWRNEVETGLVHEVSCALLLSLLADDHEAQCQICNSISAQVASREKRFPESPPIELAQYYLVLASHFRDRPFPKLAEHATSVQRGRPLRPRLLLQAWEAIGNQDQAAFEKALQQSLEFFAANPVQNIGPNNLVERLAIDESVLYLLAKNRDMRQPSLPLQLLDLIITHDSIGMPSR
jgi:hypothetical protein